MKYSDALLLALSVAAFVTPSALADDYYWTGNIPDATKTLGYKTAGNNSAARGDNNITAWVKNPADTTKSQKVGTSTNLPTAQDNVYFQWKGATLSNHTFSVHNLTSKSYALNLWNMNTTVSGLFKAEDNTIEMRGGTLTINQAMTVRNCGFYTYSDTNQDPVIYFSPDALEMVGKDSEKGHNGFSSVSDYAAVVKATGNLVINVNDTVDVVYHGQTYALREDGTIAFTDYDYSTYFLSENTKSASEILAAAGTHAGEFTGITVDGDARLDFDADVFGSRALTIEDDMTLTVQGGASASVASLSADSAAMELSGALTIVSGTATLRSLTLSNAAELTLGSENEHDFTLALTEMTVNDNAVVNANLVFNDATLTFAKDTVVTMGCSVTIGKEGVVTIVLDAEEIALLMSGSSIDLFVDVESVTLGEESNIVFTNADRSETYSGISLETVDNGGGKHTVRAVCATPEPATATLSLLALAGLCARRRR